MLRANATICALPPKRRQAEQNTSIRLSGEKPDDRRKLQWRRRVIATLSGSFASKTRGECTHVLDPRGERSKAPGSKQENNRRQAEQNTAIRLSGEQPDERRKLQWRRRVIPP